VQTYASNRQKYFSLGWRFIFAGFVFVFLLTGLTPWDLARRTIDAFGDETETISLYSGACVSQQEGAWLAVGGAAGAPDRGPDARGPEFTGSNSAVFGNREGSLVCNDFNLLRTSEVEPASELKEDKFESNPEDSLPLAITEEKTATTTEAARATSTETVASTTLEAEMPDVTASTSSQTTSSSPEKASAGSTTPEAGNASSGPGLISGLSRPWQSARGYFSDLFGQPQAKAQDYIGNEIASTSELGELSEARIKLSLSFFYVPEVESEKGEMPAETGDGQASTSPRQEPASSTPEQSLSSPDSNGSGASTTSAEAGGTVEDDQASSSARRQQLDPFKVWQKWFEPQTARASAGSEGPALVVWYALVVPDAASSAREQVWQELTAITAEEFSNYLNNGYLEISAPFLAKWRDIGNLSLRVEARTEGSEEFTAHIDSMWVEADYEPGPAVQQIRKRQAFEQALALMSERTVFPVGEDARLTFHYTKKKRDLFERVESLFGVDNFWQDVELEAVLKDPAGRKMDLPLTIIFDQDGMFTVEAPKERGSLRPGRYSIAFRITDKSVDPAEVLEIEQEFSWGVLAMNTDKAAYLPGEAGYIQMAVLDETGHTLCDAGLDLRITDPTGSTTVLTTSANTVVSNPECGANNVIDTPDYYAYFQFRHKGNYQLELTAQTDNGEKRLSESVNVDLRTDRIVRRAGPTRIYPRADYAMEISLSAGQAYQGEVIETVPADFAILEQTMDLAVSSSSNEIEFRVEAGENQKRLVWSGLDLEAGEQAVFRYVFDAPDISPEFYLLGPLELDDFRESRSWQIASDALGEYTAADGFGVGWADEDQAWDSTDDTYAYRDIPFGGEDDSANYLLASSTEASDQGGTITQVEIGLEGYAASNTVTAYLQPVFKGSATGSAYSIAGQNLGDSDDDSLEYADITQDPEAPAGWTWQDVIDLDIAVYGSNSDPAQSQRLYVDQVTLKVTYNAPPDGQILSSEQKRDGSGTIDIALAVDDPEDDDLRARLEYEAGGDCAFLTSSVPSLDEAVTADYGEPAIDNNHTYQVGTTSSWVVTSSGPNQVYVDWLSMLDEPAADGEYCLRATFNDQLNDQLIAATTTLTVDNTDPTAPGDLSFVSADNQSLTLDFGSHASDSNFYEYKIYYKAGVSGVDTADSLYGSSSDPNLATNSGPTEVTIPDLATSTQYFFNIWAYDEFGNYTSATEASFYTNRPPNPALDLAQREPTATTSFPAGHWLGGDSIRLSTSSTDPDPDEEITVFFELVEADQDLTTATSLPAAHCASSTAYVNCPSRIWAATSSAGNYSSQAFAASVQPSGIPDSSVGYKWQAMACDQDGLCADWSGYAGDPAFRVDNTVPTPPGDLTISSRATTSVVLAFGASTTEDNFYEYKIYYKQGESGAAESDSVYASSVEPALGFQDYNSKTTTTITGLEQGTIYVFNIFAYDQAGNVAAGLKEATTTTVTLPVAEFQSARLRTDGSGTADISIRVSDQDGDTVRAKLEYVAGAECDFASPLNPTLDEAGGSISADYGNPTIDNNQTYQIGSSTGWIRTDSGENVISFDWLASQDLPDDEGVYCLRLNATDGIYDQLEPATTTLVIDTSAPSTPGSLAAETVSQHSAELAFGPASADANFLEYKIYYREGLSGVDTDDTLYGSSSDPSLGHIDYNGVGSTTVEGLAIDSDYVFNIWAYDSFGNTASASQEVVVSTGYAPESRSWRWYHDEASSTPELAAGDIEEAPNSITDGNTLKLRLAVAGSEKTTGRDVKLRLQYSEHADFSSGVHYVGDIGSTTPWTYADGGGEENALLEQILLPESTVAATHNESGSSVSTYDHRASTTAEWEFTLYHNGAASSTTFYFRAWNVTDGRTVSLADGSSYPSLITSGGVLSYGVDGLSVGSTTEGVAATVDAGAGNLVFGSLAAGSEAIGIQRFNISTNGENGYQLFVYERQQLLSETGANIEPVNASNDNPSAWPENPTPSAFGYHTGDDTLSGSAPSRFAADNTYAKFDRLWNEISYSPLPVRNEEVDFVYRIGVSGEQPAGDYSTQIVYILVPTF
jgi:hypothetical protein